MNQMATSNTLAGGMTSMAPPLNPSLSMPGPDLISSTSLDTAIGSPAKAPMTTNVAPLPLTDVFVALESIKPGW